ncbi:adenylate kinase, partial [Seonamhaeicola marinus]
MVKLHNKYFKPFITANQIDTAIDKLVEEIANDLGDEIPVFIGILNGSFM